LWDITLKRWDLPRLRFLLNSKLGTAQLAGMSFRSVFIAVVIAFALQARLTFGAFTGRLYQRGRGLLSFDPGAGTIEQAPLCLLIQETRQETRTHWRSRKNKPLYLGVG
jgi:hypothetical protein